MYKSKNNLLPTTIGNYFEVQSDRIASNYYRMRSRREPITNIFPRLVSGENSMQFRGEIIWNGISESSKNANSLCSFKKRLKSELFEG